MLQVTTIMSNRNTRRGLTLVELLIAVAILAMLLAAIAVAMHGSLLSFKENEGLAAVVQTGRAVLNQISRDVRTAEAVSCDSNSVTIIPPDDGRGISEIQYELSDGQLLYRVVQGATSEAHVLIDSSSDVRVDAFTVQFETGENWEGVECTKSVTVRLVVTNGKDTVPLTASAAPRRNQLY